MPLLNDTEKRHCFIVYKLVKQDYLLWFIYTNNIFIKHFFPLQKATYYVLFIIYLKLTI